LTVEAGEVVALVGAMGREDDVAQVAAVHLRPTADADARPRPGHTVREAARHVSGVAQEEDVGAPFLVREVVAMGRHPWLAPWRPLTVADDAAIEAALVATGLRDLADRRFDELSGGERARAALARCLAQDTELLLLDEPTAGVDLGWQPRRKEGRPRGAPRLEPRGRVRRPRDRARRGPRGRGGRAP
jgi:iron complex transport system ATP-binding protein